jgi:hypothetical protein
MSTMLPIAQAGDHLTGAELQASVDALRATATDLDAQITDDLSVAELQTIGREQARLRDAAAALVNRQVELIAGEARVGAEHIEAAVRFARDAIAHAADLRARLAKVEALLGFVAVLSTGSGKAIVKAAQVLKQTLG